jgi:predicted transcriptional regulator
MADEMKVIVGGSLKDDLAAFRSAWERAERGEHVAPERVLAFESWEGLAAVMTPERYRLLRHLHAHPEVTVAALARSLGRQFRRVHADVKALEEAGLVDRSEGAVRTTADKLIAEIRLQNIGFY